MLFNPTIEPLVLILSTIAFIFALTAHEGNHALVATALGDDTPRRYGRLSLNPMRHIDKVGILFFLLAGFGWASTPVTPGNLKPNPRTGNAIVALAGPIANLALAVVCAIPFWLRLPLPETVLMFFLIAIRLNVLLFVFNLIPIPPLDGFTVLKGIVPRQFASSLQGLERYGAGILMVFLLLPMLIPFRIPGCGLPISCLMQPVARTLHLPM